MTLDGVSGRVDIPDSSGLTVNGEMTLAAWIKPNQLGAPFIVSKYDSSVQQVSWTFQINGSELRFTVYGEPTGFIEGRAVSSVGADIVPGTFTHVAVTFRRGG